MKSWNDLPLNIRNECSPSHFKNTLSPIRIFIINFTFQFYFIYYLLFILLFVCHNTYTLFDVALDWHCFSLLIKSFNMPNNKNSIASQRDYNHRMSLSYRYYVNRTNTDDSIFWCNQNWVGRLKNLKNENYTQTHSINWWQRHRDLVAKCYLHRVSLYLTIFTYIFHIYTHTCICLQMLIRAW